MNYGSATLDLESFAISVGITLGVSLCVYCILMSMLNKDLQILDTLRTTYRDRIG